MPAKSGQTPRALAPAGITASAILAGVTVTAVLVAGELSITLPKLTDRRGQGREIPITIPNAIPDRDAAQ